MPADLESKKIDQLMAEADELVKRIHSDVFNEMEEAHRLQFEIHAQKLKKIKSDVQGRVDKKNTANIGSGAEGIHQAILDIIKAMQGFNKSLSG
jgi:uncharacterized protein YoxC